MKLLQRLPRNGGLNKHIALLLISLLALVLRFYALGSVPNSLNLDEVAIGYNAYSILNTGRDEYGTWFPIAFRSHDDYKAPLYIYLTTLPVALFGLNEFSVRFMSAFLGTITVAVVYFLIKELIGKTRLFNNAPLLGALLLAISPWHIQFSRAAFETNVAVFFLSIGMWAFIKGLSNPKYWFITALMFACDLYVYHSTKIFLPFLSLVMAVYAWPTIRKAPQVFATVAISFLVLIAPLIPFMLSSEGQLRFKGTSIFTVPTLIQFNEEQRFEEIQQGRIIEAKVFQHAIIPTTQVLLNNYFKHYSYDFLFFGESGPPRNHAPFTGLMYLWELPFLLIGLYVLVKSKLRFRWLIVGWLLLAPIPASLTWDAPSSTRTTIVMPVLQIAVALGLLYAFSKLKPVLQYLFTMGVITFTLFFFLAYVHDYYNLAPKIYAQSWQYGYKQAVEYAESKQDEVDRVIVSTNLRQPQNFFAFYSKYDPKTYIEVDGGTVSGGFEETRNAFGKYQFKPIEWNRESLEPNTLYIDYIEKVPSHFTPEHIIYLPDGTPTLSIYRIDETETIL